MAKKVKMPLGGLMDRMAKETETVSGTPEETAPQSVKIEGVGCPKPECPGKKTKVISTWNTEWTTTEYRDGVPKVG